MQQKAAELMANSVDPHQTAPSDMSIRIHMIISHTNKIDTKVMDHHHENFYYHRLSNYGPEV